MRTLEHFGMEVVDDEKLRPDSAATKDWISS